MAMTVRRLVGGTRRADFFDEHGDDCSIQEAGTPEHPRLLLGTNGERMLLARERAAELLPLILAFVETGRLP